MQMSKPICEYDSIDEIETRMEEIEDLLDSLESCDCLSCETCNLNSELDALNHELLEYRKEQESIEADINFNRYG